jgi:predicted MFS family arabinose efflux permease
MLFSIGLLTVGTFSVGLIPLYPVLVVCLFLTGLAKSIFDPSLQAFIGNFVPYARRGKIIGISELAWAASTLIGIPLSGMVIQRFSWQTPFFIIGGLSLVSFFIILKIMPKEESRKAAPALIAVVPFLSNWKTLLKTRRVSGILGFAFFMALANDNLFVIYGAWLEESYELSLTAIGFGTIFIGLSEVLGEGFTVFFSDRIGLKKTCLMGTGLCCLAYFFLPVMDIGLPHVLTGLFLVFFFFELTIVTSMGLSTELMPELRASTMSAFFALAGLGRVAGVFLGGMIWTKAGLLPVCLVSGTCTLLALIFLVMGFHPHPATKPAPDRY